MRTLLSSEMNTITSIVPVSSFFLLGTPLGSAEVARAKVEVAAERSTRRARLITALPDPVVATALLRRTTGFCIGNFYARGVGVLARTVFAGIDAATISAFEAINFSLDEGRRELARLPTACGGFGFRSIADHCGIAFVAATVAAHELFPALLSQPTRDQLARSADTWLVLDDPVLLRFPPVAEFVTRYVDDGVAVRHAQRMLSRRLDRATSDALSPSLPEASQTRIASAASPHANAWLAPAPGADAPRWLSPADWDGGFRFGVRCGVPAIRRGGFRRPIGFRGRGWQRAAVGMRLVPGTPAVPSLAPPPAFAGLVSPPSPPSSSAVGDSEASAEDEDDDGRGAVSTQPSARPTPSSAGQSVVPPRPGLDPLAFARITTAVMGAVGRILAASSDHCVREPVKSHLGKRKLLQQVQVNSFMCDRRRRPKQFDGWLVVVRLVVGKEPSSCASLVGFRSSGPRRSEASSPTTPPCQPLPTITPCRCAASTCQTSLNWPEARQTVARTAHHIVAQRPVRASPAWECATRNHFP
jgi:hypothetical protein